MDLDFNVDKNFKKIHDEIKEKLKKTYDNFNKLQNTIKDNLNQKKV
jgi:hypothetical protein